ncbi:MAG: hypothetical protein QW728_00700 [Thermoplasmata archaeon]
MDGSPEKTLTFTSNGDQTVYIKVPRSGFVKPGAALELVGLEHPDNDVIRLGILDICPQDELEMLKARLETTTWGRGQSNIGWGITTGTTFIVGGTGKYNVRVIDPKSLVTLPTSFFVAEFDAIIIPNGFGDLNIQNIIGSGIPIITLNMAYCPVLGLGTKGTLHAAFQTVNVREERHYITELNGKGALPVGIVTTIMPKQDAKLKVVDKLLGEAPKEQPQQIVERVLMDAVDPGDNEVTVLMDTGVLSQALVIASCKKKYAYIGVCEPNQLLRSETMFAIFKRTIEWCGVGGYISGAYLEIGKDNRAWANPDFMRDRQIITTPDISRRINDYLEVAKPTAEGDHLVPLTFHSASPGRLKILRIQIEIVFTQTITTFADGTTEQILKFDSKEQKTLFIRLHKDATVLSAKFDILGSFGTERLGLRSDDTSDCFGVIVSGQYIVAQEFKPTQIMSLTRIQFHLMKLHPDTELIVEIQESSGQQPSGDPLASVTVEAGELPSQYKWIDVYFKDVTLREKQSYWIVMKTRKGKVNLHADTKRPLGGLLKYSKDNERTWLPHNMDCLFKLYYTMESYTPSPAMDIGDKGNNFWAYTGEFNRVQTVPDFSSRLNDYLKAKAIDTQGEMVDVPVFLYSESIGELRVFNLEVKVELPTLGLEEELALKSVTEQINTILQLLDEVKRRIKELPVAATDEQIRALAAQKEALAAAMLPQKSPGPMAGGGTAGGAAGNVMDAAAGGAGQAAGAAKQAQGAQKKAGMISKLFGL